MPNYSVTSHGSELERIPELVKGRSLPAKEIIRAIRLVNSEYVRQQQEQSNLPCIILPKTDLDPVLIRLKDFLSEQLSALKANFDSYRGQRAFLQLLAEQRPEIDQIFDLLFAVPLPLDQSGLPFYIPAPLGDILPLLDFLDLNEGDTFYDIGCGLGRVSLLVALANQCKSVGIEVDPVVAGKALSLGRLNQTSNYQIISGDALTCDMSDATVLYLYRPFRGNADLVMAELLKQISQSSSPPRICARLFSSTIFTENGWIKKWTAPDELTAVYEQG